MALTKKDDKVAAAGQYHSHSADKFAGAECSASDTSAGVAQGHVDDDTSTEETNNNNLPGSGLQQSSVAKKLMGKSHDKREVDTNNTHTVIECVADDDATDEAIRSTESSEFSSEVDKQDSMQQQQQQCTINGSLIKEEQQQQNEDITQLSNQIISKNHTDSKSVNIKLPNNNNNNLIKQQQQQPETEFCNKLRRLSYLQSLLLRKWPYLALTICIMCSLLFGMLLSALTVYLMHGFTDCGSLALAAAGATPHELVARPSYFDGPIEYPRSSADAAAVYGDSGEMTGRLMASNPNANNNDNDTNNTEQKPRFVRLPSSLWPEHYDLFIWPHIAEPFNFTGKVSIRIKCREATDNITLHSNDLELNESSLKLDLLPDANNTTPTTKAPKVKGLSSDKQLQYSIIKLEAPLEKGQDYLLTIDFTGVLNDDLAGFYKIKYERQNSTEPTWIAATQFQATDARRAFPCFDEPLYKATFSIKIKHWKNMTALSNMPIIHREDSPDGLWVTDTFGKSARMSTYLVAYAVTNFESRSNGNISVWTRPGFVHTAEYALSIAGKILRHYEDFFGIEYPLPKMDMIALPDFNAGAMENWGLITYRETAMLYDEKSSSISNKQRVAVVVAHELAHQWFGNLVTPKWWDDIWLNEGFASFVEYIGVDHVEPKWRMLDQFVTEEIQEVFKLDGLPSSHQISIPVNNPDEISEIFDHISYAKGASIIRMMAHFLTKDVFKLGLQRYLRALKYKNAEQSDLWAYLTEAQQILAANSTTLQRAGQSAINVEKVMNSWTLQTGYPTVTLTRTYDGSKRATLEQTRYQPYKLVSTNSTSSSSFNHSSVIVKAQKWEIPITYTWKTEQNWEPRTKLWMHQNETEPTTLETSLVAPDNEWMLVNVDQVGYYRVNYDLRNWQMLINQLNEDHTQIKSTNRAQLLDDIFDAAKNAKIDYKFALEATKYMRSERDYLPWEAVLLSFGYIDEMLQRTPIYGDWKDYIKDLTEPYYARYKDIDWTIRGGQLISTGKSNMTVQLDTNDVLEQYNLVTAIAWACSVNDHCIQKAKSVFSEWRRTGQNRINPALRYACYCAAIENGDKGDWDFLWKAYEKEQNSSEKDRILRALGCSKEVWILARYLEWTFDKTKPIRRQDGSTVFRMIAKNNNGRNLAFDFMRERWQTIKEYYGKTSFSLGNLIRSIAISMNTQLELNQLLSFYESIKNDVGTGRRSFQIAIEEAETNVNWKNRNYKILEDWIQTAHQGVQQKSPAPAA